MTSSEPSAARRTRVLLVDDSPLFLKALQLALGNDPGFEIVGTASNGLDAVAKASLLKPDVITMDVVMPKMNGIEAIEKIMSACPTPILVLSSLADSEEAPITLEALRAGAVDVWGKPASLPPTEAEGRALAKHLKILSKVDVSGRKQRAGAAPRPGKTASGGERLIIAVVASTGATKAISEILGALPESLAAPLLIATKAPIAPMDLFARWLDGLTRLRVRVAQHGEIPTAGTVFLAPDEMHLQVDRAGRLRIDGSAPIDGFRPSGSALLSSLAAFDGKNGVGVLLGGQGKDGVRGLSAVEKAGGVPLVVDPADVGVDEMSRAAIDSVPKSYVVALRELPDLLVNLAKGMRF